MSNDEIFAIINYINSLSFSEFEIETDELKIRIKRDGTGAGPTVTTQQATIEEIAIDPTINLPKIAAPITGVFYGSPTPESAPYVAVGDMVKIGDTLCILEAMKMMNEVKSDRSGIIKDIIPQDGEPVNETETLFVFQGE